MIRPRNSTKRSLPPGTRERFTVYSCTVGQALKTDVDLRISVTKQIHVGCPVWYDYQTCPDPPLSLFQLKCSNKYCYDRFYCITWLKPVPTTPIAPRISSATLTCTPAERVWEGDIHQRQFGSHNMCKDGICQERQCTRHNQCPRNKAWKCPSSYCKDNEA